MALIIPNLKLKIFQIHTDLAKITIRSILDLLSVLDILHAYRKAFKKLRYKLQELVIPEVKGLFTLE